MRRKIITALVLAASLILGSGFTALAVPTDGKGTMPNDIEIRNADGSAPTQTTLGEAASNATIEETDFFTWFWDENAGFMGGRRMPDSPAYIVDENATFTMPQDGYYIISIEGAAESYFGSFTEVKFAKKGDVIPLVDKTIKLASGNMDSYLYQLGLSEDTGDAARSTQSTFWYRVSSSGGQVSTSEGNTPNTAAWASNSTGWWIQYTDGTYLKGAWYQSPESGLWYYMGNDGYMITEDMTPDGHYVNQEGVWTPEVGRWVSDSIGWWIQYTDGSYLKNAWFQSPSTSLWYYMGMDGYMLTDTRTPDGYYVNSEGVWIHN